MLTEKESVMNTLGDQSWRLRNLYKIKDKQGMIVDFEPNWAQIELKKPHYLNIILKARQLGVCPLVVKAAGGQTLRNHYIPCDIIS